MEQFYLGVHAIIITQILLGKPFQLSLDNVTTIILNRN